MEPVTAEVAQHGMMIFQDGWFEDNFFAWLIFSVGAGAVSAGLTLLVRLVLSLPDRGWVLEMRGYDDAEQAIVPEEAHRFRNSRFELWKFVKSVVSGACLIKGRTIKNAEEHGWFVMEEPQYSWPERWLRRGCGRIVIDFSKIPKKSLASAWYDGPPDNWIDTPNSERTLFVSRHPGARDWLEHQGYRDIDMCAHLDIETVREGDLVIGTLPVNLIADITERGASYRHLVMEVPAERRGQDLSADEMARYGARLEAFSVGRPSRNKSAERRP